MQASGVDTMPLVTALYPVRGPPTRLYTEGRLLTLPCPHQTLY